MMMPSSGVEGTLRGRKFSYCAILATGEKKVQKSGTHCYELWNVCSVSAVVDTWENVFFCGELICSINFIIDVENTEQQLCLCAHSIHKEAHGG